MIVEFNRKTIISFPNNSSLEDIETGIVDGSLSVDEIMFTDRFTIGQCNSNRFEVDVYDYDQIEKGEKIYVYQIVTQGSSETEVPIFTGFVDSCVVNRDRFQDTKHIVAYDALYSVSTKDVAKWWEDTFDAAIQVSVKTLRDSLCTYLGIDFESVTLPNDNVMISQTQQVFTISFQAVLTEILKINAANANVDREGTLRFVLISNDEPIEIDDTYAQNTTEFDNYVVPAFETVKIENTTENVSASVGSESNVLHIVDNMLLLDKTKEELADIAEAILLAIGNISYRPAQIDMIYHLLNITIGKRVQIGDNIYLVCENILSGPQLVDQHLASIGANEIAEAPVDHDATQRDIQNKIDASSLKYYRFQNTQALIVNATTREIIHIRYSTTSDEVVIFHGCIIMDVELIDSTQAGTVELTYNVFGLDVPDYHPTETYYDDGRHTMNLLYFWEGVANNMDDFIVKMTTVNCKVTIGAYKMKAYMEGMGLVGEAKWSGLIEAEDNVTLIGEFATTPSAVDSIMDSAEVDLIPMITIEASEHVDDFDLETTPSEITDIEDECYVNKESLRTLTWGEVKLKTWQEIKDEYAW